MSKVLEFLYGTEKFEIEFQVPIDIAIDRLKGHVDSSYFSSVGKERMVGFVSPKGVKIQRVMPSIQNSFKPFLVGSFSSYENTSTLSGVFRFHRFVQVFMTFWLFFVGLATLVMTLIAILNPRESWFLPFIGFLMLGLGVGIIKLGKWFSRNDMSWFKKTISKVVNGRS
ncbi:hypothetical protein KO489_01410 [Reinekea forsetii]|nr:hypothetical protein [Reinekea forsetii]